MGRPYTVRSIREAVERFRAVKGDPFLACDIITGFPGESGEDFAETLSLCRDSRFAWIHAFPYSRRPGTPAAAMKGRVDPRIAAERTALLSELAEEGRRAYVRRWLGKTLDAVAVTAPKKDGFCAALTGNYIRVLAAPDGSIPPKPGTAFRCTLEENAGGVRFAEDAGSASGGGEGTGGFDALGTVTP
jgi:threonylcarbamoyladenosine tRNA methylthiotransferase MtaB